MSALPKWTSLLSTLCDDVRNGAPEICLEVTEVPQWVNEVGEDMAGTLVEAIGNAEGKQRDNLNKLLSSVCTDGDGLSIKHGLQLFDVLRAALVDQCSRDAEIRVRERLGTSETV